MSRRQFHTGEQSQEGNFGNKRRATREEESYWTVFPVKFTNNFRSVVDSNQCTFEDHVT